MVNAPEFSLNEPFELVTDGKTKIQKQKKTYPGRMKCSHTQHQRKIKQALLNQMWRNPCLNDTYEPGSTFKIVTAAAGLEAGVVQPD